MASREKSTLPYEDEKSKNFDCDLTDCLKAMKQISAMLVSHEEDIDTGNLSLKTTQKFMRELGVIDLLFDIFTKYFETNVLKNDNTNLANYKLIIEELVRL